MSEPSKADRLPDEFPPKWANEWGEDEYGFAAGFTIKGNGREVQVLLRWIPPGNFLMGSPENEPHRKRDETQYPVEFTQGYWLGETACTQALWEAVMGQNPSEFTGEDRPVETVSWDDAIQFLESLNEMVPGLGVRLPTEAEWEYACRAGTTSAYAYGDRIDRTKANFGDNENGTVPVKRYPPNSWGLFEMHGNVYEWVYDTYGNYPEDAQQDPAGPAVGGSRVVRGGYYFCEPKWLRSARRIDYLPFNRIRFIGFRLAQGRELKLAEP